MSGSAFFHQFAMEHPLLFTILALPVILTACLVFLTLVGFRLRWRS